MGNHAAQLHRPARERLAGAVGAAAMVGLLGAGLIWGLATARPTFAETSTELIEVRAAPPPLRQRPIERPRTKTAANAPSPRNLRNKATDVVAPLPVVRVPPLPVIVAPAASVGVAAQSGASDRPGPGQGAGGEGNGTGGGADGGEGGAGFTPPQQLNELKYGYLAPELRARGAQGTAEVIFHVSERGSVGACRIRITSGDRDLDAGICEAIQAHLRFRPSRDPSGQPVGADIIASHGWIIDREGDGSPSQ